MANMETTKIKEETVTEKSVTLIEHVNGLNALMNEANEIEEKGEDIPLALMDKINQALTNKSEKIDRCVAWITRCGAEVDWLKSEKSCLDVQIKRVERSVSRMKELAGFMMNATGESRLEGLKGHYFRWQPSKAVIIDDKGLIPQEFIVRTVEFSVDRKKISAELKLGRKVPGTHLEERKSVVAK